MHTWIDTLATLFNAAVTSPREVSWMVKSVLHSQPCWNCTCDQSAYWICFTMRDGVIEHVGLGLSLGGANEWVHQENNVEMLGQRTLVGAL